MKCPVCQNRKHLEIDLHSDGFAENIIECSSCGAIWSLNHGHLDMVKDSQIGSFLQTATECVEADDYNLVG